MASTSASDRTHPVVFTTQTAYPLPSQKFMIPASWKRYQLSQLVNKALSLAKPIPFDFLVRGEILRTTLGEWCSEKGIGEVCFEFSFVFTCAFSRLIDDFKPILAILIRSISHEDQPAPPKQRSYVLPSPSKSAHSPPS